MNTPVQLLFPDVRLLNEEFLKSVTTFCRDDIKTMRIFAYGLFNFKYGLTEPLFCIK